ALSSAHCRCAETAKSAGGRWTCPHCIRPLSPPSPSPPSPGHPWRQALRAAGRLAGDPLGARRGGAPHHSLGERLARDPVLFPQVCGRIALAGAGSPGSTDIAQRNTGSGLFQPMADRPPRPHVLRFLLRPDDLVEMWVGRDELPGCLLREGVELL